MESRFDSECPRCLRLIYEGDEVVPVEDEHGNTDWLCPDCADKEGS